MDHEQRRFELARLARGPERPGALAEGCLLIAQGEYPELTSDACLAEIDRLATRVKRVLETEGGRPWRVLQSVLGGEQDFVGDQASYDAPENSHLNRVLERRRGLPILLSVLWVEVARGAGIPAFGIGLPGHFVARIGEGNETTFVDPFERGLPISREDALRRAAKAVGKPGTEDLAWLEPVGLRAIFLRVLANLVKGYEQRGDVGRLERTLSDLLALSPGDGPLLARRGEARALAGDRAGALLDLNQALTRLQPGPAFDAVYARARRLAQRGESEN